MRTADLAKLAEDIQGFMEVCGMGWGGLGGLVCGHTIEEPTILPHPPANHNRNPNPGPLLIHHPEPNHTSPKQPVLPPGGIRRQGAAGGAGVAHDAHPRAALPRL